MDVLRLSDLDDVEVQALLARFELGLKPVPASAAIPGSYWGDPEAGLIAGDLYARPDTPLHSVLHETAHFVCMTLERRQRLFQDAGGDDAEENAVCYLQVLLSAQLSCISPPRLFRDMDTWGYSFRLGSTKRWFAQDADDARSWLKHEGLIRDDQTITWKRREKPAPPVPPTLQTNQKARPDRPPTTRSSKRPQPNPNAPPFAAR